MKSISRKLCLVIYYLSARFLPVSYRFGLVGRVSKWFRGIICSHIFQVCGSHVNVERGAFFGDGSGVQIGDYSGIGVNCQIPNSIIIGKYVMMGPECTIYGQNHEFSDLITPMMFQGYKVSAPVVIDDDVWIGGHVIILPGTRIGRGSIIGAGAVVASDLAPYSICVGNPAKVIRTRINKKV